MAIVSCKQLESLLQFVNWKVQNTVLLLIEVKQILRLEAQIFQVMQA
jgi:hypothetical protein